MTIPVMMFAMGYASDKKKPNPWHFMFIITLPLYIKHLHGVRTLTERALDPMLPLLVISTFLLSLIAGLSFIVFR